MRRRFRPSVASATSRSAVGRDTQVESTPENISRTLTEAEAPSDSCCKDDQENASQEQNSSQTSEENSSSRRRTRIKPSVSINRPRSTSGITDKPSLPRKTGERLSLTSTQSSQSSKINEDNSTTQSADVVNGAVRNNCIDAVGASESLISSSTVDSTGSPNQCEVNSTSAHDVVVICDDSTDTVKGNSNVRDSEPTASIDASGSQSQSPEIEKLQTDSSVSETRTLSGSRGTHRTNSSVSSSDKNVDTNKEANAVPSTNPVPSTIGRRSRIKPVIKQKARASVIRKTSSAGKNTVVSIVEQSSLQTDSHANDETRVRTQGESTPVQITESPRAAQPVASATPTISVNSDPPSTSAVLPSTSHPIPDSQNTAVTTSGGSQVAITGSQGRRRRATPNLSSLSRRRSRLASASEDEASQSDVEVTKRPCLTVHEASQSGASKRSSEETSHSGRTAFVEDAENINRDNHESRKRKTSESGHNDIIAVDNTDSGTNKRKESSTSKRRSVPRVRIGKEGVDPTKMTMFDLIYYNPKANPLRSATESVIGSPQSVPTSPSRSVIGSPPRPSLGTNASAQHPPSSAVDSTSPSGTPESPPSADGESVAPQVKIAADGSIVLDEESLIIQRSPDAITLEDGDVVYEDSNTVPFNPLKKRIKSKTWQLEETLKFYKALSQVGTDFSLMALMFPKRNRTELKRKFKREEKANKELIDKALTVQAPMNEDLFKKPSEEEDEETIAGLGANENEESVSENTQAQL